MSTQEPVSAYGVFKAARDVIDKKKKSKKYKKRSAKAKYSYQGANGKASCASTSKDGDDINKMKLFDTSEENITKTNRVKAKSVNRSKLHKNRKAADKNLPSNRFEARTILNLENQIYTDDSKNLSAEEQQKKKVKDYLIKQLEVNDDLKSQVDTSFRSQDSQEEYHSNSIYSDKNSSKNYSFQTSETGAIESFIASEDNDHNVQSLSQAQMVNSNKKRKKSNLAATKTKSNTNTSSAMPVAKKYKNSSLVDKNTDDFKQTPNDGLSLPTSSKVSSVYTKVEKLSNVKLQPLIPPTNVVQLNSIKEGKRVFQWLVSPVTVDDFFDKYWEQKACLIQRQQSNFFSHLISFKAIDEMLLKNHVEFTKNIDITSYKNGVRETLNPDGRALPPIVWDYYGQGCSIRLLNPQTFMPAIYSLSTTMQEYFHCLVGANAYLTPPNSQGFAPHYDDIEAFVLQIEGRKRWKLYKPRYSSEILPRNSSWNFSQQDIGKPLMDTVLEPGDVMYFPRGTIHQACTETGYHSLHITLSVYQKQSFADLFEKMVPILLEKAITSKVELRRGLPLYAWQHAGLAFSEDSTKERADLTAKVTQLMHKCIRDMPLQEIMDAGMDQLAKRFQHEALPPEILPSEKLRTVFGSRSNTNERGECVCDYDIDERTNVRLLRANILRLIKEEGKIRIYYYLDNSKEYCQYEANFIEIAAAEAASVEVLIKSYPQYVGVSQLPLPSDEDKITLATALWERGLLMMEKPFR